jgi:hypothetical protein
MNGRPGVNSVSYTAAKRPLTVKLDTLKGSYYANPVVDVTNVHPAVKAEYRPFYGDNVCMCYSFVPVIRRLLPTKGPDKNETNIEGFEEAFKNLGRLVFDIGCQLASACQPFGQYM